MDKTVPFELQLTNGRKRKIIYEQKGQEIQPVLEIIIQQIFGIMETPEIFGVPVLLKLLSPARRPLQITNDLKNFWKNTWPEICKEMKVVILNIIGIIQKLMTMNKKFIIIDNRFKFFKEFKKRGKNEKGNFYNFGNWRCCF